MTTVARMQGGPFDGVRIDFESLPPEVRLFKCRACKEVHARFPGEPSVSYPTERYLFVRKDEGGALYRHGDLGDLDALGGDPTHADNRELAPLTAEFTFTVPDRETYELLVYGGGGRDA